jgi:hypothetical protein
MNHEVADLSTLEPGQLCHDTRKPLPRMKLGRVSKGLLIAMRIYVLIAVPIVVYAFVKALLAG